MMSNKLALADHRLTLFYVLSIISPHSIDVWDLGLSLANSDCKSLRRLYLSTAVGCQSHSAWPRKAPYLFVSIHTRPL